MWSEFRCFKAENEDEVIEHLNKKSAKSMSIKKWLDFVHEYML